MTTFERLTDWTRAGRLSPEILLTHRFDIADYRAAIAAACGKAGSHAVKVVFQFSSTP